MNKSAFIAAAPPITLTVADQTLTAEPKSFSTGSVGFYLNGKITVMVNGQPIRLQVSGNLTAIGSKEWPQ